MAASDEPAGRVSSRTRSILAWVLLVLGTLILLVGSLTVWVKRQALDTDAWVDVSSELLEDDDVREALSVYIVDQLYTNVDVEARLEQRLPPDLDGLAAPISGALRPASESTVNEFLQRPRVQELLGGRQPRGARGAPADSRRRDARRGLDRRGHGDARSPQLSSLQISEELGIGEGLEARIPEDAGKLVVLESDQLSTAQDAVRVIKALSWLVIILAFAAFAGAVWLARDRRAMLRNVGDRLRARRDPSPPHPQARRLVPRGCARGGRARTATPRGRSWIIGTGLLAEVAWALVIYGVVMLLGAVLAGPSGVARRMRGAIAPTLRDRPGIAWAVLAGVYLLLVLWGPVPALRTWLGVLLLGALVALGFEAFRRLTVRELEPAGGPPRETVAPAG